MKTPLWAVKLRGLVAHLRDEPTTPENINKPHTFWKEVANHQFRDRPQWECMDAAFDRLDKLREKFHWHEIKAGAEHDFGSLGTNPQTLGSAALGFHKAVWERYDTSCYAQQSPSADRGQVTEKKESILERYAKLAPRERETQELSR